MKREKFIQATNIKGLTAIYGAVFIFIFASVSFGTAIILLIKTLL